MVLIDLDAGARMEIAICVGMIGMMVRCIFFVDSRKRSLETLRRSGILILFFGLTNEIMTFRIMVLGYQGINDF